MSTKPKLVLEVHDAGEDSVQIYVDPSSTLYGTYDDPHIGFTHYHDGVRFTYTGMWQSNHDDKTFIHAHSEDTVVYMFSDMDAKQVFLQNLKQFLKAVNGEASKF